MINKLLDLAKGLQWYDIVVLIIFPTVLFPFYLGIKKHINKLKSKKMTSYPELDTVCKVYGCTPIEAAAFLESPINEDFVFSSGQIYLGIIPRQF